MIAHRGASGYRPEHTRAAFRLAAAMLVCLLVLTAWPALVSERVFPEGGVIAALQERTS